MTDPSVPALTAAQRLKIGIVRVLTAFSTIAVFWGLLMAFMALPLPAGLALWAVGAFATHIWLFAGVARGRGDKPGWHDLRSYATDSGIPMIVFGWPISAAMMIVPEFVQDRIERLLGIEWRAGVRTFV